MSGIIFKCEIKTSSTEALQDRLDTLIRTPVHKNGGLKGSDLWNFLGEAMAIERELSKRNALYPIYRFSKLQRD